MKKITLSLLALLLLAGGWWWWRGRSATQDTPHYQEIAVQRGNIQETVLATGTLEPQIRLELASPVAGRLEEVLVREGDAVTKGQIVAWVSSTERATLLDAARARGPEELAKWEKLYNPTPVIAPLDGTVIARLLEPGQTVDSSNPILVLSDRLIVRAQVDETDMARIALHQEAEVRLDAYPDQALAARVEHIAYESETVNNVTIYKVEVLPHDPPPFIRSGMSAAVTFIIKQTNNVLVLPIEAVHGQPGKHTVLLPAVHPKLEPTTKEIVTGMDDGRNVEIRSGLAEGDTVLIQRYDFGANSLDNQKSSPLSPFGRRRR
ncbi:MAG: HlyD family efflux transporter periplasmic adaptor subunit [Kiritimatiellae bacterium]|nr:HlyD family efflux transporter periplasmic adaptor subunit [Kiritimatiellia bacterium]